MERKGKERKGKKTSSQRLFAGLNWYYGDLSGVRFPKSNMG